MKLILVVLCCILQSISGLHLSDRSAISSRIIGGEVAEDGIAPYQCSLQVEKNHHCGCAIISNKWILTAGHCTKEFSKSNISILVGTNNLKSGGKYYEVEEIMEHERYFEPPYAYDIAVVSIVGTIEFNEKVQPIKLSPVEVPEGVELQLTGWGATNDTGAGTWPDDLMILHLNSITTEKCREIFAKDNIDVHEGHMCTFTKVGAGACFADSGGPLVRTKSDKKDELVGIVNFGHPPCGSGWPDAYAKVAYFNDWIKSHTDLN